MNTSVMLKSGGIESLYTHYVELELELEHITGVKSNLTIDCNISNFCRWETDISLSLSLSLSCWSSQISLNYWTMEFKLKLDRTIKRWLGDTVVKVLKVEIKESKYKCESGVNISVPSPSSLAMDKWFLVGGRDNTLTLIINIKSINSAPCSR